MIKRRRILTWAIVGILFVAAVSAVIAASRARVAATPDEIPLAEVKRGDIDVRVYATGELRASQSIMLTAPAIGGDALQITSLVRTGALVKKGEIVVEFNPSEQEYKLEQSHSELLQAEQEITKARADAVVLNAEDKVALLKARYDVRRAELDVQKNELVSQIDAQKNQLALQQAKRVLAELEKDLESHQASGQAAIYLAQEKQNKAKLAIDVAQQNLQKMRVASTMDGMVSVQKNTEAAGDFYFSGMSLPDYHPGDETRPGSSIAQVVDPQGMDLITKVSEHDQGNVKAGQAVEVVFDALPDRVFHGTVKALSGMSMHQIWDAPTAGSFEISIQLSDRDDRLRSGFTAQIVFLGANKKNVLFLPRQALFMKDGKRIVYVKRGSGYEQREVKVDSETESRVVIEGLEEGARVAFVDPTAPRKTSGSNAATGSHEGAL
jgi:multidrug efflux pump subunit AcrA (membrane-fusion protein)